MEILFGCLFNSIWLIVSIAFGWLLFKLFAFVSLPLWLEFSIIIALSLVVGLSGMFVFIKKFSGDSWAKCWEEAKGELEIIWPTVSACVVAIICYLIISQFVSNIEIQPYIVGAVALGFWWVAMSILEERIKRQNEKQKEEYHAKKVREEQP